jgi:hypothetical protein
MAQWRDVTKIVARCLAMALAFKLLAGISWSELFWFVVFMSVFLIGLFLFAWIGAGISYQIKRGPGKNGHNLGVETWGEAGKICFNCILTIMLPSLIYLAYTGELEGPLLALVTKVRVLLDLVTRNF